MFATADLGGVFVPLNTRLAAPEIAYMLDDSGTSVLVWAAELSGIVGALGDRPTLRHRVGVADAGGSGHEALVARGDPAPIDTPVRLDDVCMIMYTSGTTGSPKGAMLTHGNLT
jgi:fatty-acyl-CoA synthase